MQQYLHIQQTLSNMIIHLASGFGQRGELKSNIHHPFSSVLVVTIFWEKHLALAVNCSLCSPARCKICVSAAGQLVYSGCSFENSCLLLLQKTLMSERNTNYSRNNELKDAIKHRGRIIFWGSSIQANTFLWTLNIKLKVLAHWCVYKISNYMVSVAGKKKIISHLWVILGFQTASSLQINKSKWMWLQWMMQAQPFEISDKMCRLLAFLKRPIT